MGKCLSYATGAPLDGERAIKKVLLAASLSFVWWSGDPTKHAPPVIVHSDGVPGGESGCESWRPKDYEYDGDVGGKESKVTFNDDVLDGALTCIDGTAYWLVSDSGFTNVEHAYEATCCPRIRALLTSGAFADAVGLVLDGSEDEDSNRMRPKFRGPQSIGHLPNGRDSRWS